jgi:enoyl-CoA hydratase/carnithine racemase
VAALRLRRVRWGGTVTFDRPDRLNALTLDVYADLRDLLAEVEHRDDVHVLVITGAGKGFCSGGDVDDIIGDLLERGDNRTGAGVHAHDGGGGAAAARAPEPVIAAVNGTAAGLARSSRSPRTSGCSRRRRRSGSCSRRSGLAGADMGCAYLCRVSSAWAGPPRSSCSARRWMPRRPSASDWPPGSSTTQTWPRRSARWPVASPTGPTFAYAATKSLLTKELDMSLPAAIELEAWTQALLMRSEDHAEFYRAFTEGRDPHWRGR